MKMRGLHEAWQRHVTEDVEPESIDLSSFEVKDELNQMVWVRERLDPKVREKLLEVVDDFFYELELEDVEILDVIFTGSLANFNWSEHSDVDLHIMLDFASVNEDQGLVREFFNAKRSLWNRVHQIEIFGYEVEVYVQDDQEPHHSTGQYSVAQDRWLIRPSRFVEDFDESNVQVKSAGLMDEIDRIQELIDDEEYDGVIEAVDRLKKKIKRMRQTGLEAGGAFSVENLAFKVLRRTDYLAKLSDFKHQAYDKKMSLTF
tara:strand:- start:41 stop:817 length:777 start_codon:yes stop_codon:yes gene_type:complete